MWQHETSVAPFNRDLELAIIDASGEYAILFPCRRVVGGWIKAATERRIKFRPTHWREWSKEGQIDTRFPTFALPPKAGIRACDWNVCFGLKADFMHYGNFLFDHLVGT